MMAGYTKLFSSILASTVWCEDYETRIVWITLLALANREGIAEASVPGLANLAHVPVEACRRAVGRLEAPDPDSRSREAEGRRIRPVDGGWLIINHGKYREKLNQDERRAYKAKKQAEYRARARECGQRVDRRGRKLPKWTQSESESESDTDPSTPFATLRESEGAAPPAAVAAPPARAPLPPRQSRTKSRQRPTTVSPHDRGFAAFWEAYPNKRGKADALKAWRTLAPSADLQTTIMAALAVWVSSDEWTKDGGKWVPLPVKWLSGERWTDEPPKARLASAPFDVAAWAAGKIGAGLPRAGGQGPACEHLPACHTRQEHIRRLVDENHAREAWEGEAS